MWRSSELHTNSAAIVQEERVRPQVIDHVLMAGKAARLADARMCPKPMAIVINAMPVCAEMASSLDGCAFAGRNPLRRLNARLRRL